MREPKREGELRNQLKAVRTRLGLSQQELALAAGVARQTIGGVEAGDYALSMVVALRLARALGCPVEELFWLEEDLPTISASPLDGLLPDEVGDTPFPVALGTVSGRWIATPLVGDSIYRGEMVAADGIATRDADGRLQVRLLDAAEAFAETVLLSGCTPALSLWARAAERQHPGLRVGWTYANSLDALARLARGETHLAGIHLHQEGIANGEPALDNADFVRKALPGEAAALVHLGVWEEGLLVAQGNPKNLRSGADLAQPNVRIVNRESGAGMRHLLDRLLSSESIAAANVTGYSDIATDHFAVARAVRDGRADVGVSTRATADAFGLTFVALQSVRYDFALRRESLELSAVRQLLSVLHHRSVRSQLAVVAGYDTTRTGEIVEVG